MPRQKQISVSIFFPCYNDAKSIGKLVRQAFQTVKKVTRDYEIIVVDDGSTDSSRRILETLTKKHRKLRLVLHEENLGYGGALRSGFEVSSKDVIFYTDGDGQYDVREFPILLNLMTPDVSFVNGIKMTRHDPTYRIFLGNIYSFFARWLFWLPVYDVDCDFRLIRKEVVDRVKLQSNSGSICVELVKKAQRAGAKFRQVSVHHFDRRWGESQFFQPKRILRTFFELGKLWFKLIVIDKIR